MSEMLVETFEVLERCVGTDGRVTEEQDAEALALIESLGLDGQMRLNKPAEQDEATPSRRFPYRKMTAIESAVYTAICPSKSKLKEYDDGAIPLRVLQVAAHAKGMFKELYVWSAASPIVKDPVLVGAQADPAASWRETNFILARWGAELLPFDELLAKAATIVRGKLKSIAKNIEREAAMYTHILDVASDDQVVVITEPCAYHLDGK